MNQLVMMVNETARLDRMSIIGISLHLHHYSVNNRLLLAIFCKFSLEIETNTPERIVNTYKILYRNIFIQTSVYLKFHTFVSFSMTDEVDKVMLIFPVR